MYTLANDEVMTNLLQPVITSLETRQKQELDLLRIT